MLSLTNFLKSLHHNTLNENGFLLTYPRELDQAGKPRKETYTDRNPRDFINASDSVVTRAKIRADEGTYHGYLSIPDDLPESNYAICASTDNMGSMDEQLTTIHWQPVVQTDCFWVASFDFYTASEQISYTIVIEGLADDGSIICLKW